ncbi:MAG: hypothetical protein KF889_04925 [Alphaproteobacteria bacterium]|nr:hypothetical protein [Alphaproteobacteria bacterium]MCW5742212.1 hypothetical protein [Alphaproteobacteria bacterium]
MSEREELYIPLVEVIGPANRDDLTVAVTQAGVILGGYALILAVVIAAPFLATFTTYGTIIALLFALVSGFSSYVGKQAALMGHRGIARGSLWTALATGLGAFLSVGSILVWGLI